MRLIHTSDWHLGRTLLGLSLLPDQAAFGEHLIELVHDFQPDMVIIVGDLFERFTPSEEAVALFDQILQRLLLECKTRVVVAPGQQDGVKRLSFGSWLYERRQLNLVTSVEQALSPIIVEDADGPVHVNAIPFFRPHEVDAHFRSEKIRTHAQAGTAMMDHLTRFRRLRRRAVRAIVSAYMAVEGGELCGEERPLDGGDESFVPLAMFEGIQYGALGYLHRHQELGPENRLVYSGTPFPFTFESSPTLRGPVKMEMDASGRIITEVVPLPVRRHFWRFSGSLERLLLGPSLPLDAHDVVLLELSDDSELLSAELIGRLRGLYPNLWRIERGETRQRLRKAAEVDPLTSFEHFYQAATGETLDDDARELLEEVFQERQAEPA